VGQRIRQRRVELGWSLRELEARSGIDNGAISRYEAGTREPSAVKLGALAGALDVSVGELLHGTDAAGRQLPEFREYLSLRYPELAEHHDRLNEQFRELLVGLGLHAQPLASETEIKESLERRS
jgi:transcriptional regulator with XRE-family HTH domain